MKKDYKSPSATLVSMNFDEHIATSGSIGGQCGWDWSNYASAINSDCSQNFFGNAL